MPDRKPDFSLLKQVSRANLERDVKHLSTAYPTRHTLGRYLDACADWLADRMRSLGYRDVSFHTYEKAGKRLRNVVTNKEGRGKRTILVSAHYDSRMQNLRDAESRAPGANDNATGVAAALEVARLLRPVPLSDSLRFVFFSGEEQGLWGSYAYAPQVKREGLDLRFVFNLDQIGYPPQDRALYVDRDEGGHPSNNAASDALVKRVQELARTVIKVPTRVDPAYGSDYVPFEELGYTIVGLYEAGKDYPAYHRSTDTADKVDFAYVADMTRLCLATLLAEGI
jgi:Predicted aminopeptidases